ncbi:hypothetical protein MsAg5_13160 [Methanosarcinaceae archaeon Ag5]|uniref:Zona occludens toxin N-terminal domain-containing protein n=1 Tax=Methanolapillus africanus TaxID=3028297 RepID=A0AAE4MKB1_9EURY|nr:hypothetical protein [Methanosarcinaceae archaeon Ag5]
MEKWIPLHYEDYAFYNRQIDILDLIRKKVVEGNESWDFKIRSKRGKGKSTIALALGLRLDHNFAVSRNVAFTTDDWFRMSESLGRGAVILGDEMGTRMFGSSHEWNTTDNKSMSDEVQINRTDGIIFIGTSLDDMRITNRVREVFSVDVYPERKITVPRYELNQETGETKIIRWDLAIVCILRIAQEDIFGQNGGKDFWTYPRYAPRGIIKRVILYHPPTEMFEEYSRKRNELRRMIREDRKRREADRLYKEGRISRQSATTTKDGEKEPAINKVLRRKLGR